MPVACQAAAGFTGEAWDAAAARQVPIAGAFAHGRCRSALVALASPASLSLGGCFPDAGKPAVTGGQGTTELFAVI